MMTGKKTKKKTVKKVKDTTDVGVLEPEIVETNGDQREQAQGVEVIQQTSNTGIQEAVSKAIQAKAFEPTKKMIAWLDYELQNPGTPNNAIARATNIAEQTLYEWRKNLDFLRWYKAEWDKRLIMHAPKLDQIGLKNSDGNYKYWVSMQQRVGNLEQQAVKLQNNIQMNVNFLEDEGKPVQEDVV